jgi:thiamine pyrophosphate-dependent acetolactate synthase large subunit-like protein
VLGCRGASNLKLDTGTCSTTKNYERVDLIEPKTEFKKMAESVGVHAETREDPHEAHEKMKWGIDQVAKGKPALIDSHLKEYTEGPAAYSYIFKRLT